MVNGVGYENANSNFTKNPFIKKSEKASLGTSTDSGPPGDGADDRSSAWASFLKCSDTLVDSGAPKLFNLVTPSQEISETWESFLKKKYHVTKLLNS